MRFILPVFLLLVVGTALAQNDHSHRLGRVVQFPDIPGYKTLKTDLHMHSVFSDGSVWPDIRVQEALMDGLDAISLTEHLEYQPHKADIPHPDRNRSYELARKEAEGHDLIIIRGSEITRSMPPGHNNAVFIQDANKLIMKDSVAVFRAARDQGAFVFWNHPDWTAQRKDGIARLTDMHRNLLRDKLLHGIEVVNDQTYSDEALQIALDNNLTIIGTSDVHGLVDWTFLAPGLAGQRPVTLVFATERTAESIRDGLMNRRTVVAYKDLLIGRPEFLVPLVQASLSFKDVVYEKGTSVLSATIVNHSSAAMTLRNKSGYSLRHSGDVFTVPARGEMRFSVRTRDVLTRVKLGFEVLNAVQAPNVHPVVTWESDIASGK